jgi:hypothetical protein
MARGRAGLLLLSLNIATVFGRIPPAKPCDLLIQSTKSLTRASRVHEKTRRTIFVSGGAGRDSTVVINAVQAA